MPFTDEQFDKFIDTLTRFQETMILLARIEENTKHWGSRLQEHIEVDLKSHVLNESSIYKAHQRLDEIEKDIIRFRTSIKSAYYASTFIISFVVVVVNVLLRIYLP